MSIILPKNFDARLKAAADDRELARGVYYDKMSERLGSGAADAMRELYSLYDEGLYLWLAGLWDPKVGGFYYSNSGRDTEGFLPDVESTAQTLSFITNSGLCTGRGSSYPDAVSADMREKLVSFALSLQDSEDGYFYHPQWGKKIVVSRKGRDLGWALSILRNFGVKPKYLSPLDRASEPEAVSSLPEYLQSPRAFRGYLEAFDDPESKYHLGKNSYGLGNLLQSQAGQIIAAGEEYQNILFDWLDNRQYENGLWEEKGGYDAVNGLMKLCLIYSSAQRKIPRADDAILATIDAIRSEERADWVCVFYNPWITAQTLLENIKKYGGADSAESFRKILMDNAEEAIRTTKRKIETFRKSDGSFSYYPDKTIPASQNARVALSDTNEGDVNASCISSTGTTGRMCAALGIEKIPLFSKEDASLFFELIDAAGENRKIRPDPRGERK